MIFSFTRGFVGTEAAITFNSFVEKYENVVNAEDVLSGKITIAKLLKLRASDQSSVIDKVISHCKNNIWEKSQVDKCIEYLKALPGEHQMSLYNGILQTRKLENVKHFHGPLGNMILSVINSAKAKQPVTPPK